jgi:hypothetical protein
MSTTGERMTTDDALWSVLYSSTASAPFDDEQLAELLTHARAANAAHGITGMLLYRAGRFVQVIEGPEAEVRELLADIERDPRHTGVRVLMEERLGERNFSEWTMGYEPIASAGEAPEGFRSTFADLEGEDAGALLRAVREMSLWFRVRARRTDVGG